jgi:hypothetical protein
MAHLAPASDEKPPDECECNDTDDAYDAEDDRKRPSLHTLRIDGLGRHRPTQCCERRGLAADWDVRRGVVHEHIKGPHRGSCLVCDLTESETE